MFISPATTPPASPTLASPHDRNTRKCHTPQRDAPDVTAMQQAEPFAAELVACKADWIHRPASMPRGPSEEDNSRRPASLLDWMKYPHEACRNPGCYTNSRIIHIAIVTKGTT